MACFAIGYAASLILPSKPKPLEGLTIYHRRRGPVSVPTTAPAAAPSPA